MRLIQLTLLLMIGLNSSAQNGKASTVRKTFSRETSVSIEIKAGADKVWAILTKAEDYPRWNSTIVSLEGKIAPGEKIRLKSTLDEKRTFKLKVKEFQPKRRLVWGDSKGERIFTLSELPDGSVRFNMSEKIGGIMFPMYAKYIPPFDESFEQLAADLKKEAEGQ